MRHSTHLMRTALYLSICALPIASHGAAEQYERKAYTDGRDTTSTYKDAQGQDRTVKINPTTASLWDDVVAAPDRVTVAAFAPIVLDDDNEPPPDSVPVCCYAVVSASGHVFNVDINGMTINVYPTVDEFKELYYYESHFVLPINDETGAYVESPVFQLDSDIAANYTSNNTDCDASAMADGFTAMPSQCDSVIFDFDDFVGYPSTGGSAYRASSRSVASRCAATTLAIGPYTVNISLNPVLVETTCNMDDGNSQGSLASGHLHARLAGTFTRLGVGDDVPWAALFGTNVPDNNFVNDPHYVPPQVPGGANGHGDHVAVELATPGNQQTLRLGEFPATVTGTFSIPSNNKRLQYWLFYNGPTRDQITLCARTDLYGGNFDDMTSLHGGLLRRQIVPANGINASEVVSDDWEERCDIVNKGFHGESRGYLVPTLGSVFGFDLNEINGALAVRLPHQLDDSFDDDFWETASATVTGATPTSYIPMYVLTNLVPK